MVRPRFLIFGDAVVPPTGGSVTGASLESLVCHNRTTHQRIKVPLAGQKSWDCEAEGLIVDPGDDVEMRVRGFGD